jgi:hypothetical protein
MQSEPYESTRKRATAGTVQPPLPTLDIRYGPRTEPEYPHANRLPAWLHGALDDIARTAWAASYHASLDPSSATGDTPADQWVDREIDRLALDLLDALEIADDLFGAFGRGRGES